ncbi:MAG: cell division protein FtsQ/DivIB [Candidatus Competibacterales bacterium]|nr:cell division protein FtsQ/DivIB [Candidatus Competibacterales bacterium]
MSESRPGSHVHIRGARPVGATPTAPPCPPEEVRRQRRHRAAWLVLLLLNLVAVQGTRWLLQPQQFPLRRVEIEGELRQLTVADLQRRLADRIGHNLLLLDLPTLRRRLAAEPWVAEVRLHREWPDRLRVRLREHRTYARWGEAELVTADGHRFQPEHIRQVEPHWPQLVGPAGSESHVIDHYRAFDEALAPAGLNPETVRLDPIQGWSLVLGSGLRLVLGQQDPDRRLQRFLELYPRVLRSQLSELAVVDLRYPDGAALRWLTLPDSDWLARQRAEPPTQLATAK